MNDIITSCLLKTNTKYLIINFEYIQILPNQILNIKYELLHQKTHSLKGISRQIQKGNTCDYPIVPF